MKRIMYHTHVKGIPFILSQRIEIITKWGITLLIVAKDHKMGYYISYCRERSWIAKK